jgi:hypothetical protein
MKGSLKTKAQVYNDFESFLKNQKHLKIDTISATLVSFIRFLDSLNEGDGIYPMSQADVYMQFFKQTQEGNSLFFPVIFNYD